MKHPGQMRWTGLAFGGMFAALGDGAVLSAGVMAQTAPTQTATPPAAPAGATPNLNSATIPPGDASREEALAGSVSCTGCHGPMGVSVSPEFPRLAGQHPDSLTGQLLIQRAATRPSQIMNRVAAKLSDQDISDLVVYFTAQEVGDARAGQDAALAAAGPSATRQALRNAQSSPARSATVTKVWA